MALVHPRLVAQLIEIVRQVQQMQVSGLPGSDNPIILILYALGGVGGITGLLALVVNYAKNRNDGQASYRSTLLEDITGLRKDLKDALEALQAARLTNVQLASDLADAKHEIERLSEEVQELRADLQKYAEHAEVHFDSAKGHRIGDLRTRQDD